MEHDRQYYKALSGRAKTTIPRAWSFCQYTFLPKLPSVLVVEDASKDERCGTQVEVAATLLRSRCLAPALPCQLPIRLWGRHQLGRVCGAGLTATRWWWARRLCRSGSTRARR